MQTFSKRLLKFKRAPVLSRYSKATFMSSFKHARVGRRVLPAMGMSAAAMYFMNSSRFTPKLGSAFSFSTRFASAEEDHKIVEIEGVDDLAEGEMMPLQVGPDDGDKILIARYEDKIYALSNFCSHFGVPLAGSVLFDDKVICPAHNAAFSIVDGFPEQSPAKDGLQTYEVFEEDGKKFVKVPSNFKDNRVVDMATRDPSNKTKFVIVGGGAAGLAAAETLRQSDFTGEIIVLSSEDKVAYDRTLLSKALAKGNSDKWLLRDPQFLDKFGIDFRTNSRVKKVDVKNNEVTLSDDTTVPYDKLLLATGGYPKRPILPGIDLDGVFTLRSAADQKQIKSRLDGAKKVVIVGASFIGYECAANLASTYKGDVSVSVVDMASTPFERVLGKEVGGVLQKLAEENGVKFSLSNGIKKIVGEDGHAKGVELSDGTVLDADFVIMGTGIQPATQFVQDGIELEKDGSLRVDPYLKTSADNVYAAGDIATFPYWVTGDKVRVEHWNHASQQGEVAAFNMLDKHIPFDIIPFFWTRNFNKTLQYTGYHREFDEVFVDGSLEDHKFVAYYIKDDKVQAATALGAGAAIHILKEAMRLGMLPSASEIKEESKQEAFASINKLKEKIKSRKGASTCRKKSCCQKKAKK